MSVEVRAAVAGDATWMVELSRASFAPRLHDYLVSAQSGAARFWETVLAHPSSFPDRCFLVAEGEDGERVGFADFSLVEPGVAHLSYICVVPAARGRGVAVELLREYVARHPQVQTMQLDVFEDNAAARALYDRLGFGTDSTSTWWVADLALDDVEPDPVRLDDLHTSLARWDTYGFCELSGTAGGRPVRFGRLGEQVLRCFEESDLTRRSLVAGVVAELPGPTRILAMVPGDSPPGSAVGDLRAVNRTLRLSTPSIRTRLERP